MILKRRRGVTLFSRFKHNSKALLLDPHVTPDAKLLQSDDKLILILSPALYWIKKVSLPVKYLHEAKRFLPSLFEEILPEGNYSYAVYKKGDEYLAFAYEDSAILTILKHYNIELARIDSIHFAQSVFNGLEGNYALNEKEVLSVVDGVVVLTPRSWVEDVKQLDLLAVKPSKERISLKQFGHIVNSKTLYKIGAVTALVIFILVVELFTLQHKIETIQSKSDLIFQNYKLQPTMMQNRAILSKYEKRYNKQMKLREIIAFFLAMQLPKGTEIRLLEFQNNKVKCIISGIDTQGLKQVEKQLHAKNLEFQIKSEEKNVQIEVSL